MSSLDLIRGRQVIEYMTNQSGVTLVEGDVVVSDGSNNDSITTQAGVTSAKVVGVVQETTLYNGSNGRILTHGYAPRVNVNGSNVTRGHFLFTGAAKAAGTNSARSEGAFGIIRTSGTSPDATIFGAPDAAGGAGGGSGSITASGYTQNTARLLGRTSASAGAIEEITVGSGLSLAAGSITATGGGLVGQPVALAQPLPRTTFATGTNNSVDFGWAHPIIVPASMKVRGFTIEITVDAAGAIEWGLFGSRRDGLSLDPGHERPGRDLGRLLYAHLQVARFVCPNDADDRHRFRRRRSLEPAVDPDVHMGRHAGPHERELGREHDDAELLSRRRPRRIQQPMDLTCSGDCC